MSNNSNVKLQTRLDNDEEYDFCHVETGKRFKVKWTPPSQNMKLLTRKFPSPRQISRSSIRKSVRAFTRQRINKSLNFEPGRNDRFKTPSSEGLDQFSRSAKIMRALNFNTNSCPGNNSKRMSVTKVLNFDVSPSPKSLQSPASNFSASSPIDSVHLSMSSSDSHSTSIDENQNRTPSHPRKSAKKSLDYMTPQSNKSIHSPMVTISPVLRSGLKEKIDGIVEISETPNVHSMKRISNKLIAGDIVNTSRNLYYDFERECSDSSPCPSTPKNTSKPIPESMSAIKKSHRKERLSRRFEDKDARRTTDDDDDGMHLLEPEDLPTSPFIQHLTPKNRMNSVIESPENEDKNSDCEDNISETGSLFSYSRNKENIDEPVPLNESDLLEGVKESDEASFTEPMPKSPPKPEQSYLETPKSNKSVLKAPNANALSPSKKMPNLSILLPASSTPIVPRKVMNAHTPENDPSAVPNIISSSIKKSHKKVKEEHRKRLIKPTALHTALLNSSRDLRQRVETVDQELEERPTTPENLNSSRLLLPQFDSVKKSHKKEKQTKKLQGYSRRSMLLDQDISASAKSLCNVSMSLRSQLDESPESVTRKKSDSLSEIVPIDDVSEAVSSPLKKMKTPEGETVIKRPVENESGFEIFTPIRKRRTQLVPADENTEANGSVTETVDEAFITPVKGKHVPKVAVEDSTPEDRLSTAELVKDIEHSIKKSHRKDKLGAKKLNRLNRSLNTSFNDSLKTSEPQPSTSKASINEAPMITPPNCLKSKTYLHLLQNSSIKRSHKKERAKRKSIAELNRSFNSSITTRSQTKEAQSMEDTVLSDDGSIFSEEDRASFLESEGAINADQDKGGNNDAQEDSLNGAVDPALNEGENNSDSDQSYQGSIFDDSERLQSMEEEGI